jgi:maltose alpha-D-glucosyltransferase/alpha-amylase
VHARAVAAFLESYRSVHDAAAQRWASADSEESLMDLYLIQKAAYEICYEAANRITWLHVPTSGLAALARHIAASPGRTGA